MSTLPNDPLHNLEEIRYGLMDNPPHVSEKLQWCTTEGQQLYEERKKTAVNFYMKEVAALTLGTKAISQQLSEHLVVIDLGAGLSHKTIAMLTHLLDGNTDRKICYIPVDVSDVINNWSNHLEKNYPDLYERIVLVKPVLMDMMEAVKNTETILQGTGCEDWEVVYCMYGPTATIVRNTFLNDIVKAMQQILHPRGRGGFMFTSIRSHPGIEAQYFEEFHSKPGTTSMMRCILLGLNQVVGANLDTDMFEYEYEFLSENTCPEVNGKWAGFSYRAKAKADMECYCEKLNMTKSLKHGEYIQLSDDVTKNHFYDDTYIHSLAEIAGLQVYGIWNEPTDMMSSVYMNIKNKS